MAKKKTVQITNVTRRASRLAKAFEIQQVQLRGCSVAQDLREGLLPGKMSINVQFDSHFTEKQRQLVIDLRFILTTHYEESPVHEATAFKAVFRLTYQADKPCKVTELDLAAFSQAIAAFHAWPYWREFVQSMTTRMGLPALTLPPYALNAIAGIHPQKKKVKKSLQTNKSSRSTKKKRSSKKKS